MLNDFLASLRAAGLSRETVQLRRYHLQRVENELGPLPSLTTSEIVSFLATDGWSREYRRSMRASLTKFYAWAYGQGLIGEDPARDLPRVQPTPPRPRPTPAGALESALARASDRVRLMILLASEAGLRRAEVCKVHERDLVEDLIGVSLLVHGKGGKQRLVPLSDSLTREIRGSFDSSGWLFPNGLGSHLTAAHVGKLVSAELPEGITMHTLRHRFATRVYAASRDILATQQLLGHSSPATTQAYVAIDVARLRDVVTMAA